MSAESFVAGGLSTLAVAPGPHAKRTRRRWLNTTLLTGLIFLGIIVGFALLYPIIDGGNAKDPDFTQPTFAGPSWDHWLGTDNFGRDNLLRLAVGGRIDLYIASAATLVTVVVGALLGLICGYFGGWFDSLIMRLVDFMVTIPYLVLVIAIVAILGPGTNNLIYAIWFIGWVTYARIVRVESMVVRNLEYVEAARVVGMGHSRIMLRHVLPNVVAVAIIYSMADFVLNILTAASLSFLGVGVQAPNPEWGLMVAESRDFFLRDWRLMTYPGLAMVIIGAAFGLIGDGLTQALRPKG